MRSFLALVVAAALIAGALMIRDRQGGGGGLTGGGPQPRIVCITELRAVCEALPGVTATIEEAGVTAAALAAGKTPEADAWLTLAPWRDLAAEARLRGGHPALPGAGAAAPVARSPLVLVVARERGQVLERRCNNGLDWRCIGDNAGRGWGDLGGDAAWGSLKPGYADPSENATGLLVLGTAVADFFGDTDFSTRDFDRDAFLAWLTQLEEAADEHGTPTNTPLAQQLQFGPGRFDVVGTTEAEAGPLLARAPQRAKDFDVRYPEQASVAEVVLAHLQPGDAADRLRGIVGEAGAAALAEAGWRVEGQGSAPGVRTTPALPATSNLPPAGVLDALRARWEEVAE